MPNCRSCGAPVFFLAPKPNRYDANPKSLPINVDPDPEGTVAIFEVPSPTSVAVDDRNFTGQRAKYMARLHGEARKSYASLGGVLYRIHFDTCSARNR